MSTLPPKADMRGAIRDVCFGPVADMNARRGTFFIDFLLGGHVSAWLDYGPIVYENEPADHVCSTSAG